MVGRDASGQVLERHYVEQRGADLVIVDDIETSQAATDREDDTFRPVETQINYDVDIRDLRAELDRARDEADRARDKSDRARDALIASELATAEIEERVMESLLEWTQSPGVTHADFAAVKAELAELDLRPRTAPFEFELPEGPGG